MTENTKKPAIRFKGYTEAWEQRKAKNLFMSTADKGHPELPVLSATQDRGMIKRDDNGINIFHNKKNEEGYKRVVSGQFVIHLRSFQGGFAHSAIEGIISPAYTIFSFQEPSNHDDNYWKYVFSSKEFIRRLETVTYGIRDGRSINYDEFLTMNFCYPKKEEQKQIAAFLDKTTQLITLHQRKYDKLINVKKSCLEKMFPKSGSNVPEIRFKGFIGAWEQRRLGEVSDIVRGASPRPIKDPKWFDVDSDIGWLRISDVTEQDGRIHFLEQRISEAGQERTRVLTEPHLLLSIAATVGKPVINYVKTGVHDGFLIFQNPNFDREFMFQWLEMFRLKWSKYGQPGSQVNLNSDLVKSRDIMLPDREEQSQIGQLFTRLDHLITLHQRELEKLKNIKKSCLEKMFV